MENKTVKIPVKTIKNKHVSTAFSVLGKRSWEKRIKEHGKKEANAHMKSLIEKRWKPKKKRSRSSNQVAITVVKTGRESQ